MSQKYELIWIDVNAEVGPLFKLGRDVYERERPGERVIRLKAVESYPGHVAPAAAQAFTECARAWGAPVVYIIEPNLAKPPAAKFLFEWSRTTHANGSVEQCYLKTTNRLTRWMGRIVLKLFTDGSMPFEAIEGEAAIQARLDSMDLSCPREGFEIKEAGSALVLHSEAPPSLMRSILRRAAKRLRIR